MAMTQIPDKCMICGKKLDPEENAIFVGVAKLTRYGRSGSGEAGIPWGGPKRPVRKDHLRVVHRAGGKPKGGIHRDCFDAILVQHGVKETK